MICTNTGCRRSWIISSFRRYNENFLNPSGFLRQTGHSNPRIVRIQSSIQRRWKIWSHKRLSRTIERETKSSKQIQQIGNVFCLFFVSVENFAGEFVYFVIWCCIGEVIFFSLILRFQEKLILKIIIWDTINQPPLLLTKHILLSTKRNFNTKNKKDGKHEADDSGE